MQCTHKTKNSLFECSGFDLVYCWSPFAISILKPKGGLPDPIVNMSAKANNRPANKAVEKAIVDKSLGNSIFDQFLLYPL